MRERGADGTSEVIEQMDMYSLSKDDFDAVMEMQLLLGPAAKPDITSIPANVKAALTRKYNTAHAGFKSVSRTAKAVKERFTEDGDDEDEDEDEDEDDEGPVVQAPKTSGKGKSKAKGTRA